ncbi:MAG: glycosyltransferase family 4 protein [Planctomycetes bacterium]|nr:glycosyltransferase family 4 protein [Planctomycetota bacterium]
MDQLPGSGSAPLACPLRAPRQPGRNLPGDDDSHDDEYAQFEIFRRGHSDLPVGKPIVMDVGSLHGTWFDWRAMAAAVAGCPDCAFVCIGDHRGVAAATALARHDNVHFLGPKAQRELPDYLHQAAVCVVPFRSDLELTGHSESARVSSRPS